MSSKTEIVLFIKVIQIVYPETPEVNRTSSLHQEVGSPKIPVEEARADESGCCRSPRALSPSCGPEPRAPSAHLHVEHLSRISGAFEMTRVPPLGLCISLISKGDKQTLTPLCYVRGKPQQFCS